MLCPAQILGYMPAIYRRLCGDFSIFAVIPRLGLTRDVLFVVLVF